MSSSPGFVKHDDGKLRFDLIEPKFLEGLAAVLTHGAVKYRPNNWKDCPGPYVRYYAALQRHLNAYAQGKTYDAESGFHHLYHAACCLMFLVYFDEEKQAKVDAMAEVLADRFDVTDAEFTESESFNNGHRPHKPFVGLRDPSDP